MHLFSDDSFVNIWMMLSRRLEEDEMQLVAVVVRLICCVGTD
jgi:hypothetical protein